MKKTILVAALLVLCIVTTTIGGTFAWFTDEVTSANNVIKAGNLDVEVYTADGVNIQSKNTLFNDVTLWEPGAVAWENLTVSNVGNLALKYKLSMNASNFNNLEGNDLTGALKVGYVSKIPADATRESVISAVKSWSTFSAFNAEGSLAANTSNTYGVVVYWQPTSEDNKWNANNGQKTSDGKPLFIDLGIKLVATQLMAEKDSFDDTYDEGAYFTVSTLSELKKVLTEGGKASLGADITVAEGLVIPEGVEVTLDLNGKTISGSLAKDAGALLTNNGTLVLEGDQKSLIVNNATNGSSAIMNKGILTINGGSYKGAPTDTSTGTASYAINTAGKDAVLTVNNVNVNGRGAIGITDGSKAVINGGTYHTPEVAWGHAIYAVDEGTEVVIKDGVFSEGYEMASDNWGMYQIYSGENAKVTVYGGTFKSWDCANGYDLATATGGTITIYGGTFAEDPSNQNKINYVADGYKVTKNDNGTWTVGREYTKVEAKGNASENGAALAAAISGTDGHTYLLLEAGTYKMPSFGGSKEVTIVGTKDTVIDNTKGSYLDNSTVSFEGVTIKGSTGYVYDDNGNKGSDYAALYSPNVTYTDCTFEGPFRIGRDGATFINCKFTNLGNDYVWTYGNDATFEGCTFESEGKALLIYSDGGSEVSKVSVKNCVFNASEGAYAGAISNQPCAAIEIQNYGNGVNLTTAGNTIDSDFSGEWRIKAYHAEKPDVIVNGVEYTSIALDGKTMTIDGTQVTVNQ